MAEMNHRQRTQLNKIRPNKMCWSMAPAKVIYVSKDNINSALGERISDALRQRAPVKQLRDGEYRTRCLRPERHEHGDAHPSMDFDLEKGANCRVCGFKAGLVSLARELGIGPSPVRPVKRFETDQEAIQGLVDERKLRRETTTHFRIGAGVKRQAWAHPLPSGHRRLYRVTYPCNVCGKLLTVTSEDEKTAIRGYVQQEVWGHQACHERRR